VDENLAKWVGAGELDPADGCSPADHEPLMPAADAGAMPIVVRRGRPVAEPHSRLLRFERPPTVDAAATAIGPAPIEPDSRHELARLALDVVVRTSEPQTVPPQWRTVPFGREVDRTRAQLGPIRSRAALARSFEREASVSVTRSLVPEPRVAPVTPGPVRVAYALRWLELGDDRDRPSWTAIVAGVVGDLVAAVRHGDPAA
jgi:hypothetical protein